VTDSWTWQCHSGKKLLHAAKRSFEDLDLARRAAKNHRKQRDGCDGKLTFQQVA
jgi:hypothetical protein